MAAARRSPPITHPARLAVALALVGLTATLLAISAPPAIRAAGHAVQIAGSAFGPATLTIAVGDTVTWTNDDGRPHTVTSGSGAFGSGNLDPGQAYSFTFTQPGTYTYACDYHPEMQGTIIVQAASAPTPSPSSDGGNAPGTGGGATPVPAAPAPGGQDGAAPNTAMVAPAPVAWLAPLLIGLGLVALAFGLIPHVAGREQREAELTAHETRR